MCRNALPAAFSVTFLPAFVRYAGVGVIGTAVHYAILVILVQFAGVSAVPASTAGAFGGAFVNYCLNHRFTFASRRNHVIALPRFLVVAGVGIAVNAVVMALILSVIPHRYLVAQVIATGCVLIVGYAANKRWTF